MASLPQLRNAVRLAWSGVPRLWRAARAAGAGRGAAADVVLASLLAFVAASRGGPTRWRRSNALRHFTWQAYLAARHGQDLAVALAEAQERGSADPVDTAVDEENNRRGRDYGLANAAQLRRGSRLGAVRRLDRAARELWERGELAGAGR